MIHPSSHHQPSHTSPKNHTHVKGRALKVQRNGGGGACFPFHYDNPGRPNKRRLTCLLYLNPEWCVTIRLCGLVNLAWTYICA